MKKTRILLMSDLHYCQDVYGGITIDEKARRIRQLILEEHEKEPFALALFLGDYSLDHWAWNVKGSWLVEGRSYTKELIDNYLSDLPMPHYFLPGNHEQYGEALWQQLTGCSRSAEFVVGDYLFILWDSYGENLDPTEHSDGTYTPLDVERTRALMAAHPDKKVILCSHFFVPTMAPEEQALIADARVVCLCQGHTHYPNVNTLPMEYGGKKVLQTGAWASISPTGAMAWGLRELYLTDGGIESAYIVPEQTLYYKDQPYTIPPRKQNCVTIKL